MTDNVTAEERDTWQAKALVPGYSSVNSIPIQQEMLDSEAQLTGEDVNELVAKILTKYTAYQKLIGFHAGLKRKMRIRILRQYSTS